MIEKPQCMTCKYWKLRDKNKFNIVYGECTNDMVRESVCGPDTRKYIKMLNTYHHYGCIHHEEKVSNG